MKVRDILNQDEKLNTTKAKRIVQRAKERAKKANPGESETNVQPYLGSHVSTFLNR